MSRRFVLLCWLTVVLWLAALPSVSAHSGGTPRLTNVPVGPYRLYAWSDPEPWRAGEVHLSIIVTQPAGATAGGSQVEAPITDATVTARFTSPAASGAPIAVVAVPEVQLGTLYYEVSTRLPAAGLWQIEVDVVGPQGGGQTDFEVTVLPAQTVNLGLVGGAGGVLLLLIVLMGVWSRRRPAAPVAPRRGGRRVPPRTSGESIT